MKFRERFSLYLPVKKYVRSDIQALRALAVTLVVVYHLAQDFLPGGYIGVDVFFVISGFLITSHLASSMIEKKSFTLLGFYARRIRRLIPASLTVLAVTLLGVVLFVPRTFWAEFGRQIIASAFYVQNWVLAGNAVDYSAPRSDASPVQHFWSLSTEEQFYLIWPLMMMGLVAFAAWRKIPTRLALALGLSVVVIGSFLFSLYATYTAPTSAYFITSTRAWEFGAGGLFALLSHRGVRGANWFRILMSWLGIAAMGVTAFAFSSSTPFPGWAALAPVLATLAVLYGGDISARFSTAWIFRLRVVQYLGDVSYSVYLWHWPLKVILPFAFGMRLNNSLRVAIIVLTLVLAALTKRFIEDRFRVPRVKQQKAAGKLPLSQRLTRGKIREIQLASIGVILSMIGGALVVAAPAGAVVVVANQQTADARADLDEILANPPAGFGAATAPDSSITSSKIIAPDPILTGQDSFEFQEDGTLCQDQGSIVVPTACTFGSKAPDAIPVALVGDSHAGHWTPALTKLAEENNWRLTVFARSGCAFVASPASAAHSEAEVNCDRWKANAKKSIEKGGFRLVVTSSVIGASGNGDPASPAHATRVDELAAMWSELSEEGVPLLAIRDNPDPTSSIEDVPSCVAANLTALDTCSFDRVRALRTDPQLEAAERTGVPLIDLTETFCDAACPVVIGGALVYRDRQHITKTFNETQAPALGTAIAASYPELFAAASR